MGIYVFTKEKLRCYLEKDANDPQSEGDFGKNVIPAMLREGERMFAYPFSGYWKDVGTIGSLWEANMELLGERPELDLYDDSWRIYSRQTASPPQFIASSATLENTSVTAGCEIYGTARNSVLGKGVKIMEGAIVENAVLMDGVTVEKGANVAYAIVNEGVTIKEHTEFTGVPDNITVVSGEV